MIDIKPMDESYIHIDCLHEGPIDPASHPTPERNTVIAPDLPPHPWSDETIVELSKKHNRITHGSAEDSAREFMREMILRYGTCAILAWEEGRIVGQLRFHRLAIAQLLARAAPERQGGVRDSSLMFEPDPATLWVQCVMTSRPYVGPEPIVMDDGKRLRPAKEAGARKGTGLKLAQGLVAWARQHKWKRILTRAHADIDHMYGSYGWGGRAFWEKAEFRVIGTSALPFSLSEFDKELTERQRKERGISHEEAYTCFHMMCEL